MKASKVLVVLVVILISILLLYFIFRPNQTEISEYSFFILDDVTEIGEGEYLCSFEGVNHNYILDLPDRIDDAPLVIMLHGYGSNARSFRLDTGFEKEANLKGYAVAYVTGAPSPEDSTSATGWNSGIGKSGNNDVGFLCALANYLCKTYSFDSNRVFAVGFSNGAFMTHRLATEANDVFAAAVSVAGLMPESVWNSRPDRCSIGFFQITGEKDDAVPKYSDDSAKYTNAPAIEDVVEYYVNANALDLSETCPAGKKAILTKYSSPDSVKEIWNLFIPDGRHSWPSESFTGININELILEFLDTQ